MTTTWTSVATAQTPTWTPVPSILNVHQGEKNGNPIGLLLTLTYTVVGTQWTDVTNPSGTVWTSVLAAT